MQENEVIEMVSGSNFGKLFGRFNSDVPQFPLRMLVFSELAPRDLQTGVSKVSDKFRVDKDNFKNVLAEICPNISLDVPNRLGNDPKEIIVDIPIKDINYFKPDLIAENVPALKELLDVRDLLVSVKENKLSQEEVQSRLERSIIGSEIMSRVKAILFTPTKAEAEKREEKPLSDSKLDDLFNLVEVPEQTSVPSYSIDNALERIISMLTSAGRDYSSIDSRAINSAVAELDGVISAQVNEILHHNEFRRLESAWRGLKFLVDHTDFRENIQIEVMSVPKQNLLEVFHESVYLPEYNDESEFPLSVVIADYEFDNSNQDIELLTKLSSELEDIQIPLISSVDARFFGLSVPDDINTLPYLKEFFNGMEYVKWRGFRENPSAKWITLVFNRFLLRLPYGKDNRIKRYDFNETGLFYVWGNPVWALGALINGSFARIGWATEITGTKNGTIEDLPVREHTLKSGEKTFIPLSAYISMQLASDLADNGIVALICRPNFDSAMITTAPTSFIPAKYSDQRSTEASILFAALQYQLLVSRIAQYIRLIQDKIVPGNNPQGIEDGFTDALIRFISIKGHSAIDSIQVKVMPDKDKPNLFDVGIYIRPSNEILGGMAYVELHLPARI
ncbi:MAG: type VI secretion system contractile sheath large subunit [Candidatus Poribacteria bacterium]